MLMKQFTVYMPNRPGQLAGLARQLAKARVNVEGISTCVMADVGLVQIVVRKHEKTAKILKKAELAFTVQDVVVLSLPNRPGSLAKLAELAAGKGMNINYIYGTAAAGDDTVCHLVIGADDIKRVERVLRRIEGAD